MKPISTLLVLASFVLSTLTATTSSAAGKEDGLYAELLKRVATEEGVRWSQFGAKEKQLLQSYLNWASQTNPLMLGEKNEQLAFWINAHNACVMKFISERLPLKNVMAITGFRDQLKCNVAGFDYSLVQLESSIIRPLFNDPRTHFVLWWGVKGGPRLDPKPYVAKGLEAALEKATRTAVMNPLFVRFESKRSEPVALSPLFEWYKADFGTKENDLLEFIRVRLPTKKAKKLPRKLSKVSFLAFDWTLDNVK